VFIWSHFFFFSFFRVWYFPTENKKLKSSLIPTNTSRHLIRYSSFMEVVVIVEKKTTTKMNSNIMTSYSTKNDALTFFCCAHFKKKEKRKKSETHQIVKVLKHLRLYIQMHFQWDYTSEKNTKLTTHFWKNQLNTLKYQTSESKIATKNILHSFDLLYSN